MQADERFLFRQPLPATYHNKYTGCCLKDMDMLNRYAGTLSATDTESLHHVGNYIEWQVGKGGHFTPSADDDVELRTYLLGLKISGVSRQSQREQIAALRRFYDWAKTNGVVEENPFNHFNFDRPFLTREQIRRRQETFVGTAEEREIARLGAINKLAEQLNRSSDMQTILVVALETVVGLMSLRTAWAYLLPEAGSPLHSTSPAPLHDFVLAAFQSLPPGLAMDNCYYLCKPNDCHCQSLFRAGQLRRAVNIVECTRVQDSDEANGDNQGLLFHASVPLMASGQPIGIINVATQEWQFLTSGDLQLLSAIGVQVGIALERARLYDLTHAQRLRLERELKLAREVQESLLPKQLPEIPGFSLAADWRCALEMAGDFYDVFSLKDGRWALVIGDVSDKGAPAAMFMAMTRSLIRTNANFNAGPAAILQAVNQQIKAHSTSGMFVTLFYAALDASAHTLTYANAGHNPPLLRRAKGGFEKLMPTGPLLAIFEEPVLTEATITLEQGDVLVAYTDGVTDALNPEGEDYGFARLVEAVVSTPLADAQRQLDNLSIDLAAFTQGEPLYDDITCLVLVREQQFQI
jgi:serine phosphatase RsbU (regulator of sigma subunit)